MEIDRLRKELNELLDNITKHSNKYSEERTVPSLEVGAILTKVNRVQEKLAILRHLLEQQELAGRLNRQNSRQEHKGKVEEIETPIPTIVSEVIENEKEIVEQRTEEIIEEPILEETIIEQLPVTKLVDSLTLNDRYLFANELFNKDMSAFNALVKSIDECSNFDEAQKLYVSFDWEIENEHVLSFTNLVERRFS